MVPGKSSVSAKARRAVPHGQPTNQTMIVSAIIFLAVFLDTTRSQTVSRLIRITIRTMS